MHRIRNCCGWRINSLLYHCADAETKRLRKSEMRIIAKVLFFVLAVVIVGHVIITEAIR